jgi:serine/threonine protein kinase/tetratricopeptide (TPR) repeat protein
VALPEPASLLPLAESIADGSPIDWDAVEARANAEEQAIIRELRILANVARLHRSLPADLSASSSAAPRFQGAPAIGKWGHLALVERLGGGTAGEVYRAWDPHLERDVALKLLRINEATDDPESSPIVREGRLLARVRHPNVITVHGVAVQDGRFGLWMDLVRGATLEQRLLRQGPFSAREAALIGIDLCRALAAIHAAGLIHRDVKAQNVMREDGGRIVLMDLGTGREIDPHRGSGLTDLAGTPLYLAPEIFDGAPASERSDLYSLGVLLYRLVTGSFPMRATAFDELTDGHAKGAGVRLRDARADLPTTFVSVIDRAIAKDPAQRHASAGALESDLVRALDDTAMPVATPAAGRPTPHQPAPRRLPSPVHLSVGVAIALIAIGLPTYWYAIQPSQSSTPATSSASPSPATTAAAKTKLAVLPPQNRTGLSELSEWPALVQALLVDELTGVHEVGVLDPLSLNGLIEAELGPPVSAPESNPRLFDLLRRSDVTLVVNGSIIKAANGYELRISLVDPVSGETRFPIGAAVAGEETLGDAAKMLADGILGFLRVLPLANDKDLRAAFSFHRHNIRAVSAFLQASQFNYRNQHAAAEAPLRRAIEIDPSFLAPRIWLVTLLARSNRAGEAKEHYEYLLTHQAGATPADEALIKFAGAVLARDPAGMMHNLESALDYLPGNNVVLVTLADLKAIAGDCAGAFEALRPAVAIRWRYPPVYALSGACAIQTGQFDEARKVLREALTLGPVYPSVYGFLDALAISEGDTAAAQRNRQLFESRLPELDRRDLTDVAAAYDRLGSVAAGSGQPDRAAALVARAAAVKQHLRALGQPSR